MWRSTLPHDNSVKVGPHLSSCMRMKCAWIFNCYTWPRRNSYANGGRIWGRFGVFVSGSGDCRRRQTPTSAPSMLGLPLDVFATTFGRIAALLQDIISTDEKAYQNFWRFCPDDYNQLLTLITHKDTNCRKAISAGLRLAVILRFLATGTFQNVSAVIVLTDRMKLDC